MDEQLTASALALYGVGAGAALWTLNKARVRMQLSLAKHPGLAGHPRTARRVAALLPSYAYDEEQAYGVDGAPPDVVARRRAAFARLVQEFQTRYAKSLHATTDVVSALSDLQFISAYRVPFQFKKLVGKGLKIGSFVASTEGVTVTDLDGNRFFDLTGSYGVNLLGNDFYKRSIEEGAAMVRDLGPVLGAYHPVMADNLERLRRISGMEEVSFHMSGTEAVMQAVRLSRYHSGRDKVVRFCGSYHGWWGDVQPGIGNPMAARDTFTLSEMGQGTLRVLRSRSDIACVLINPLQALHPNKPAPTDASLLSNGRRAHFDRAAYTRWLQALREVCDARGIVLIFDEVFLGFRLAPGGAQEYFGVRADLVTYGKTLGGGLPVGVLCGCRKYMRRFREDRPADICFARGTFNSHPAVMGAMAEFLDRLDSPEIRALYEGLDERWNARAARLNALLAAENLPVRVANMSSVWVVLYDAPSRYNWMLQFYLRTQGLALPWTGTGRLIFSLDYTDRDFEEVARRFVAAASSMRDDGWFWAESGRAPVRRRLVRETIGALLSSSRSA